MDLIEFVSSYSMAPGERLDALGAGVGRSNRPAPTKLLCFPLLFRAKRRTCPKCRGPESPLLKTLELLSHLAS